MIVNTLITFQEKRTNSQNARMSSGKDCMEPQDVGIFENSLREVNDFHNNFLKSKTNELPKSLIDTASSKHETFTNLI